MAQDASIDSGLARVCVDLDARTGVEHDLKTGELRWGTALASLTLGNPLDAYFFYAGSAAEAAVLQARVTELMPIGGAIFALDLDASTALARARDVGCVVVIGGPKIVIGYGNLARLPFALREALSRLPRRHIVVRTGYRSCADWNSLVALRYGEQAFDLVIGIPPEMCDKDLIETALLEPRAGALLTNLFGCDTWRPLVQSDQPTAVRLLRALYAQRFRSQLGLHVSEDLSWSARWAEAEPIFATSLERRLARWREATGNLASSQDELYLGAV